MRPSPIQCVAAAALLCYGGVARSADWLQFGYDAAHSGNNPDETTLSRDNVAALSPWWFLGSSSHIDVAPVYLSGAQTVAGMLDLVFVVTEDGETYAIRADTGSMIWLRQTGDVDYCAGGPPIWSAPAIDPGREFVYSYGCDGFVHKFAVYDGTEVTGGGWPQVSTLKPFAERGSSALAVSGDGRHLYSVSGSWSDGGDYQGHLTTIDLKTGGQIVFNAMCSDMPIHFVDDGQPGVDDCAFKMSGIWGRPGATSEPATGRVYITTGNGRFDANIGGFNWGDSVLAFRGNGTGAARGVPVDSYTPSEYQDLEIEDLDLGSVSLAIIPPPPGSAIQHIGLQTGKDGVLRLIDLGNMNGTGVAGSPGGEIATMPIPTGALYTNAQPAVWTDTKGDGAVWVFVEGYSGLSALKIVLDGASRPALQPVWFNTDFTGSASPIIANDVLYAMPGAPFSISYLYALDPHDGAVLWQSQTLSPQHWETPIVVNGSIFVSAGGLQRFSLGVPPAAHNVSSQASEGGSIAPETSQSIFDGETATFTIRPDSGHLIADVSGCGGALDGTTYMTAAITTDCTIAATFVPITHTVTPTAGPHGTIEPSTPQTVDEGDTASFTLTPVPPYIIDSVTGCGGTLDGDVYTTGSVEDDCTVTAEFALDASDIIFTNGFEDSTP